MKKNLIIAFLLGMLIMDMAYALKVPNIILPTSVEPEIREIVEDYVVRILNGGRYTCNVSTSAVLSTDELEEGEFLMDDSGVTKRFVISNGTNNYYVNLTQI